MELSILKAKPMVAIQDLSFVGLGTYRMEFTSEEHMKAISQAVSLGCNFIDTANCYMSGRSEQLIGDFLKEKPQYTDKIFIMTKAGYIEGQWLKQKEKEILRDVGKELIELKGGQKHCFHPVFLEHELITSLKRLGRNYLDCFLIHNPEYYFKDQSAPPTRGIYYYRLKKAFEFCESMVKKGLIRYYGISSNSFTHSPHTPGSTNILNILSILDEITDKHHFKFAQFPFNLIEQDALEPHFEGKSLIDILKSNQIITVANRPLNSEDENGFIRLAEYPEITFTQEEINQDKNMVQAFINQLDKQIKSNDPSYKAIDFPVIQLLQSNYDSIGNIPGVNMFYNQLKVSFLDPLFDFNIPTEIISQLNSLKEKSKKYSKRFMSQRAGKIKQKLIMEGDLSSDTERPLAVMAVDQLLQKGIDNVLVGMRNEKYVHQMQNFFSVSKIKNHH